MRVVENKYKSSAVTEHCVWIFLYFGEHTTAYEYSRTHIFRHFNIYTKRLIKIKTKPNRICR